MKFLDFSVACSAVRAAMAARQEKVCFTIDRTAVGRRSKAAVRDVLTDVLEYAASYNIQITEDDGEMQIAIDAVHRPALRMLDAWETGDRAALTDEENACLNKALNTVQQCRKHARSALDVELAIAQAICGAVDYAKEAVAQNMRTTAYLRASTCIGALMDGTAQCQGYAETFICWESWPGWMWKHSMAGQAKAAANMHGTRYGLAETPT